jgi:hypothetical protein
MAVTVTGLTCSFRGRTFPLLGLGGTTAVGHQPVDGLPRQISDSCLVSAVGRRRDIVAAETAWRRKKLPSNSTAIDQLEGHAQQQQPLYYERSTSLPS